MKALVARLLELTARKSLMNEPIRKRNDARKNRKAVPQAAVFCQTHHRVVLFFALERTGLFWLACCTIIRSGHHPSFGTASYCAATNGSMPW